MLRALMPSAPQRGFVDRIGLFVELLGSTRIYGWLMIRPRPNLAAARRTDSDPPHQAD